MKHIILSALLLVLSGCANMAANQPAIFSYIENDRFNLLQKAADRKDNINILDGYGRTPLHYAVRNKNTALRILLAAGANPNVQDRYGLTPLHLAVHYRNNAAIIPLLLAGAKADTMTVSTYWCSPRGRVRADKGLTAMGLAQRCNRRDLVAIFEDYQLDKTTWLSAQNAHSIAAYKGYLEGIKSPLFAQQAQQALDALLAQRLTQLEENQPCPIKQEGWYLISGQCKNGFAHGQGKAVTLDDKEFSGEFVQGELAKGELSLNNKMLWHGPVVDAKPHGEGICMFDGAPEECKCYHGERIDSLAKQREMMAAFMSKIEHQIGALKYSIENQARASRTDSPYSYIGDLNSKNDFKRTSAQIQAAIDIFKALSQ